MGDIWFKASIHGIEKRMVVGETVHFVTVSAGGEGTYQELKQSDWYWYGRTSEEAKSHMLAFFRKKMEEAREQHQIAVDRLSIAMEVEYKE